MKITKILSVLILIGIVFQMLCACSAPTTDETKTVIWKDADGNVIEQREIPASEGIPTKELPENTEKWVYTKWAKDPENELILIAEKEPNPSYFAGNVFQIITEDLHEHALSYGTGYVFSKDGWFITNAHVMSGCYYASAVFSVRDEAHGEAVTKFTIDQASFIDETKDLFIGKIADFSSFGDKYFKTFSYSTEHNVGDTTYAVGFPESSSTITCNPGEIIDDYSGLGDKLCEGVAYIGSTSRVGPGSSGGILVDSSFNVMGMTAYGKNDNSGNCEYGASIDAAEYKDKLNTSGNAENLAIFLHPDEKAFLGFYFDNVLDSDENNLREGHNLSKKEVHDDYIAYVGEDSEECEEDDGSKYTFTQAFAVRSDFYVSFSEKVLWESGDHVESVLYGYYSPETGLDDLVFESTYTWDGSNSYSAKCDDINYDPDISKTLKNIKGTAGNPNADDLEYLKLWFNDLYEYLSSEIEKFK